MQPPFVSTVDLANFLNTTVEVDDARAIIALDAACQTIRTYTEQTLNLVRNDVQTYRGFQTLLLPELPVVQVNSVMLRGDLVDADDWFLAFGGEVVVKDWRRLRFQWDDIVEVDYDHGWAVEESDIVQDESGEGDVDRMPSDIRMVALRLAAGLFQTSGVSAGMRSESLGAYSYTRMDGALGTGILADAEKVILDRYRVKKVPVP
jgi:hypothetical protein